MIEIQKTCGRCKKEFSVEHDGKTPVTFEGTCQECIDGVFQKALEVGQAIHGDDSVFADILAERKYVRCHSASCKCSCHKPKDGKFWAFGYKHPQGCSICTDGHVAPLDASKPLGITVIFDTWVATEADFTEWLAGKKDLTGLCVCQKYQCRFHTSKTITDGPHNIPPARPIRIEYPLREVSNPIDWAKLSESVFYRKK